MYFFDFEHTAINPEFSQDRNPCPSNFDVQAKYQFLQDFYES